MARADNASRQRCAIYTRKSSEEGLEQEFNSLAAQREACEAFIRSQRDEGWVLAKTRYDDGGFSGGNVERPALQDLIADIRAGRIDIVVDRLTRSLADFARLVELFDAESVSFVSVTQQFNTTSSMGRLTLNVLLSFAQFEREVTGERIRDKIAASKRKGMWMGGNVPLGYEASERTLVINPAEAETVRRIFALYRDFGCVRRVKEEADRLGFRTKCITTANGTERGGKPFSRGHLYALLSNPIYTGQIAHRGELHPGQHPALIDDESWSAVRNQLAANTSAHRGGAQAAEPSLLAGLLVDVRGERLTPSHAVKKGRRYRYYVSAALITDAGTDCAQAWRLAAREIEEAVIRILADALTSPANLVERFGAAGMPSDQLRKLLGRVPPMAATLAGSLGERTKLIRELVEKIIVDEKTITIKLRRGLLLPGNLPSSGSETRSDSAIELTAAVVFTRRIEIGLTRHHGRAARAGADRRLVRSGQSEGDDRRVVPGAPIPRLLVRSGSASLKSGTISSNPSSSSRESSERPTALSGKA
jgi:DNA invertase Pin-like site-specific DNA recombinase